ncbi:MAG: glycosyltransferase family 1 protein [Methanosphaera sp.]|nr:glycosyltransferase family 1 protein [Methanosphaera sp.]
MKLLLFVTGRGIGGDALLAFNIMEYLKQEGIDSEIVLDSSAPGYYFKKRNISWLQSPIPNAGGHAASKMKLLKAGIKATLASMKGASLIRKEGADGVIGVIGGGAIIGSLSAKLARVPDVSLVSTPTDTKISLKLNPTLILPESPLYLNSNPTSKYDFKKQYFPINLNITQGNKNNILDKLPSQFDDAKPSILFASGSTLFDGMAQAARKFAEENDDYNIFVIGDPLKEQLNEVIDHPNIINLGYINYIADLYDLIDLAVITDDGLTLHETIACQIPVVVVLGVKYGRYHNLASVFEGAVLESDVENITEVVKDAFDSKDSMKEAAKKYSVDILDAPHDLCEFIKKHMKK